MSIRKSIAILALVNVMVALYLHLWKIGLVGSLACSETGGCAYVQGSRFGWFMGVDVALIGTIGYSLIFLAAIIGSLARFESSVWPNYLLQLLIWPALLFTVRLKYAEFVILKGFCPWCAVSAVTVTLFSILIVIESRRLKARAGSD